MQADAGVGGGRWAVLARRVSVEVAGLRAAGVAMLVLGALLPLVGVYPGLPCPLRTLTGVPCPLCGMSTSVQATLRGRLGEAAAANPAGILAVAVALALPFVRRPHIAVPAWLVALAALGAWAFELHRFDLL